MKVRHLFLFMIAGTFLLSSCKKDDDPTTLTQSFKVSIENISQENSFLQSGVFNTPVGMTSAGPATPGSSYEFSFNAGPGHKLSFATMFVQSNDLFYAPDGEGIELYDNGSPVTGDITSQVLLWDAGTEINEEPGVGMNQPPRQTGANTGPDENGTVREIAQVMDGFTYPAVSDNILVTLSYTGENSFTLRIDNLSSSNTPLAPGVFTVHSASDPLFRVGSADAGQGLEALAEDGAAGDLGDWAASTSGVTSPFAPGVWGVHSAGNLLFTNGSTDFGQGLEGLAEDGDPSALDASLANNDLASSNGVFNTPVGSSSGGPLLPGASYEFSFTASQGDYLSFATMFVQSNDLFVGPGGGGIALWSGDTPISGDITSQLDLWDGGTEVNQFPGAGADQAPRQGGANTGAAEGGNVQIVNDGFSYPGVSDIIRVTVTLE